MTNLGPREASPTLRRADSVPRIKPNMNLSRTSATSRAWWVCWLLREQGHSQRLDRSDVNRVSDARQSTWTFSGSPSAPSRLVASLRPRAAGLPVLTGRFGRATDGCC